jgi:hypothetical protein
LKTKKLSPKKVSRKEKKPQENSDLDPSLDSENIQVTSSDHPQKTKKARKKDSGGLGKKRKVGALWEFNFLFLCI